eukprot:3924042-Rhodomonas_salina.1
MYLGKALVVVQGSYESAVQSNSAEVPEIRQKFHWQKFWCWQKFCSFDSCQKFRVFSLEHLPELLPSSAALGPDPNIAANLRNVTFSDDDFLWHKDGNKCLYNRYKIQDEMNLLVQKTEQSVQLFVVECFVPIPRWLFASRPVPVASCVQDSLAEEEQEALPAGKSSQRSRE